MFIKTLFYRLYDYIYHYNLFISEVDIDADENVETQQSLNMLKEQKYATWLYIFLLISKIKHFLSNK